MVAPSGAPPSGDGTARGSAGNGVPLGAREERGFSAHAGEITALLARLARIQVAQGSVRLQRALFLGMGAAVLLLVLAAASLAGVWLLMSGLAAGLTEAFGGRVWLGELVSGVVLLGGPLLTLLVLRSGSERRVLRELGEFHGTKRDQPS